MNSTIRLSDAVEQYLTIRRAVCAPSTYKQDEFVTRRFAASVGDMQVRSLTAEHVERWFHSLLDDHTTRDGRARARISASTFNFYRARIKGLTKYLQARGMTRADLIVHVRRLPQQTRVRQQPTRELLWRMLDCTTDRRDRAILATAMNTGLRANEISALRVGDVDLSGMTLRVRISKSRLEDDMPLTSDLAHALSDWLDHYRLLQADHLDRVIDPADYLFPKRVGPEYRWRNLPDGTRERYHAPAGLDPLKPVLKVHRIAQNALARVGLETRHQGIHTLRRSSARILFDQLVDENGYDGALRVTSSFLHHSNGSTTEIYLGLSPERRTRDRSLRGRSLLGPRPPGPGCLGWRHADDLVAPRFTLTAALPAFGLQVLTMAHGMVLARSGSVRNSPPRTVKVQPYCTRWGVRCRSSGSWLRPSRSESGRRAPGKASLTTTNETCELRRFASWRTSRPCPPGDH